MIVDIPTSQEFIKSGEEHLNTAWAQIVDLLLNLKEIRLAVPEEELSEVDEVKYWESARQAVAMSIASVQHGVEAILKGRIASISPYLLLAGSPSNWPAKCDRQDTSFGEYRTVDAQDLLRLYNSVSEERFEDRFRLWFDELRKKRNKVVHSVSSKLQVNVVDALRCVLEAHEYLFGTGHWLACRERFLDLTPDYSIRYLRDEGIKGYISYTLARELTAAVEKMSESDASHFFQYQAESKKWKSFTCPNCLEQWQQRDFHDSRDTDEVLKTLQHTQGKQYQCILCRYICEPRRAVCREEGVQRLFDERTGRCLSCGDQVS